MENSVFAYLRVSTRKQDVLNQRLQIRNYVQSHAFTIGETDWYVDDATSGTIAPMEREHFKDMMEYLEVISKDDPQSMPKHILVYEISRLGRNLWEILDAIKSIERYSVLVSTSPKESFLSIEDNSIRSLVLLIISWAAEREREILVQRVQDGVEKAQSEERHSGNLPLGYEQHLCREDVTGTKCEISGLPFVIRKAIGAGKCELHGKLNLSKDGKMVYDMLQSNPALKPRQLKTVLTFENDYQRFAIIRNVRKFGQPQG